MAVAHVQTVKTVNNAGTASVTTGNITTSAGNLLICVVLEYCLLGSGQHLPVPTSAKLDNTTAGPQDQSSEAQDASLESMRISFYSWPNISAGSHSVTVVYPTSPAQPTNTLYFLVEVSGAITTAAVDGTGAGASGTGTAVATGSASSTNSDDFWIAACTNLGANPVTFAKGTGWDSITGSETNSSANLCGAVEVLANPGATSENGTFTNETSAWQAGVIAYKAAAGGGDTLFAQSVM